MEVISTMSNLKRLFIGTTTIHVVNSLISAQSLGYFLKLEQLVELKISM